jgi:hypothetical protein
MSITWEISELDGGKNGDRALKYAASLAGVARRPQTKPPTSVGGVKATPYAWGRP